MPQPNLWKPQRLKVKTDLLFLRGPIPLLWLAVAYSVSSTALVVGLHLWYIRGLRKTSEDLVISQKLATKSLRIKKRALTRGLDKLETAGLINTSRGRGKAIRVTILQANPTIRFTEVSEKDQSCPELSVLTFMEPAEGSG